MQLCDANVHVYCAHAYVRNYRSSYYFLFFFAGARVINKKKQLKCLQNVINLYKG